MGQGIGGQANSHAGLRFARDRISVEPIEELRSNLESLDLAVIGDGPAVASLGQAAVCQGGKQAAPIRQEDTRRLDLSTHPSAPTRNIVPDH